jgi:hypothetical protein
MPTKMGIQWIRMQIQRQRIDQVLRAVAMGGVCWGMHVEAAREIRAGFRAVKPVSYPAANG